jgi:hydrogenase maturation protease
MTRPLVDRVADAVLYEGYLLYPYRPSSVKNRQRWTFGGLFPCDSELAQSGAEPCALQCECLIEVGGETTVRVRARFLHLVQRTAGEQVWQEAEDRTVLPDLPPLEQLTRTRVRHDFAFPARASREPVRDTNGAVVGQVTREQQAVRGAVESAAASIRDGLFRLTVRVENHTPPIRVDGSREELLPSALVSTHVILEATAGAFVSQIDPPEQFREAAAGCQQVGVWPVLVGEVGERHTVLAPPIILYDYPQIAPESPGDLFDATEIDEILTLRILTMTDEEKREMRAADPRADALLARTEALARDELMRLHGTIRGLRPVSGVDT